MYVSKEYNVGSIGGPYKPGRFIIGRGGQHAPDYLVFAEEPAIAYTEEQEPGFNVELQYLRMRKNRSPGNVIE